MSSIIVRHWRRGTSDRLYVSTSCGRQLGWYDVAADEVHATDDADRRLIWRTAIDVRTDRRPDAAGAVGVARDLGDHVAGAYELGQAQRCHEESPLFNAVSVACNERSENSEWQRAAAVAADTAEAVATLGAPWAALHGVPTGRGVERMDHLLVGPAGIVVLMHEHAGPGPFVLAGDSVEVGGTAHKVVAHLGKLADLVAQRSPAKVPVSVVLVVHGADGVEVRRASTDARVRVVAAADLATELAGLPTAIPKVEREALVSVLRRRSTWLAGNRFHASRQEIATTTPMSELVGLDLLLDGLPRLHAA